jgi:hypothetical protein
MNGPFYLFIDFDYYDQNFTKNQDGVFWMEAQ